MANAILDPTGGKSSAEKEAVLAPRRADLRGTTVGLLAMPKQNSDVFLEELGRLLVDRWGAAGVVPRTKASIALPAADELADEIVRQCDVVVAGVGD